MAVSLTVFGDYGGGGGDGGRCDGCSDGGLHVPRRKLQILYHFLASLPKNHSHTHAIYIIYYNFISTSNGHGHF